MWRGRNKGRWVTTVNSREPILGSSPTVPSVMIKVLSESTVGLVAHAVIPVELSTKYIILLGPYCSV